MTIISFISIISGKVYRSIKVVIVTGLVQDITLHQNLSSEQVHDLIYQDIISLMKVKFAADSK